MYGELIESYRKKTNNCSFKGVKVEQKDLTVKVTGPAGQCRDIVSSRMKVKVDSAAGKIAIESEDRQVPGQRHLRDDASVDSQYGYWCYQRIRAEDGNIWHRFQC